MPDEVSSRLGAPTRNAQERCANLLEQFDANSPQPALMSPQLLLLVPAGFEIPLHGM